MNSPSQFQCLSQHTQPSLDSPRSPNLVHETPQISLHALLGSSNPETLRIIGTIQTKEFLILVNGGSIHNRCLQQYLSALCTRNLHNGEIYALGKWLYDTIVHNATGVTPFQAVYAKPPPSIPSYVLGSSNTEAINSTLSTREEIVENPVYLT